MNGLLTRSETETMSYNKEIIRQKLDESEQRAIPVSPDTSMSVYMHPSYHLSTTIQVLDPTDHHTVIDERDNEYLRIQILDALGFKNARWTYAPSSRYALDNFVSHLIRACRSKTNQDLLSLPLGGSVTHSAVRTLVSELEADRMLTLFEAGYRFKTVINGATNEVEHNSARVTTFQVSPELKATVLSVVSTPDTRVDYRWLNINAPAPHHLEYLPEVQDDVILKYTRKHLPTGETSEFMERPLVQLKDHAGNVVADLDTFLQTAVEPHLWNRKRSEFQSATELMQAITRKASQHKVTQDQKGTIDPCFFMNIYPSAAGYMRSYNVVQTFNKKTRKGIKIDGRETIELDYSSLHLSLIYDILGLKKPAGDLYAIPGTFEGQSFTREQAKALGLRMVSGTFEAVTINSLYRLRHKLGFTSREHVVALVEAFKEHHSSVAHAFYQSENAGKDYDTSLPAEQNASPIPNLMHVDGLVSMRVLSKCLEAGILALPVHDSFIVSETFADELKTIMGDAYNEVLEETAGVVGAAIGIKGNETTATASEEALWTPAADADCLGGTKESSGEPHQATTVTKSTVQPETAGHSEAIEDRYQAPEPKLLTESPRTPPEPLSKPSSPMTPELVTKLRQLHPRDQVDIAGDLGLISEVDLQAGSRFNLVASMLGRALAEGKLADLSERVSTAALNTRR